MKKRGLVNLIALSFFGVLSLSAQQATVYTTAKNTSLRLSKSVSPVFKPAVQPVETQVCVFVDSVCKFQTVLGIGGALTDASAETFYKLSPQAQAEFLKSYYSKEEGLGYNLARTQINSCDFSTGSYTYVKDNDKELTSFDISPDKKFRIPFIKKAMEAAGGKLPMMVSPWSPPAWMKDNHTMLFGGALLPEFYQSWANYYVKFLRAYEAENIPVFALSVQNEPMARQTWESCIYTATQEADFVKNYLAPTLIRAGYQDKKIIIWDHNRDLIYQRVKETLADPKVSQYVWGIGFHWYETWTGSSMMFDNVKKVHESFPDKHLIFTEGCVEKFNFKRLNDWSLGERYGNSMINDFNNGLEGWIDWNILLDEKGGPNHAGNFCFAPVIADTRTGKLIYTNSYYYIGHLSKFVQPGARRIISSTNREALISTAFVNPDNKTVVVVMNKGDKALKYDLFIGQKETSLESLPHSISTIIID